MSTQTITTPLTTSRRAGLGTRLATIGWFASGGPLCIACIAPFVHSALAALGLTAVGLTMHYVAMATAPLVWLLVRHGERLHGQSWTTRTASVGLAFLAAHAAWHVGLVLRLPMGDVGDAVLGFGADALAGLLLFTGVLGNAALTWRLRRTPACPLPA